MSDPHAPASIPAEDEPKTPMWLPALGAALFVGVGLWWAVTPPAAPAAAQAATTASAPAVSAATAAAAPPAPTPRLAPAPQGSAAAARTGDGDSAAMKDKLKELRERFGAQHGQPPPGGASGAKGRPAR